MKRIILMVSFLIFVVFNKVQAYNYPIENPYSATILGSSTMMTPNIKENIPTKTYKISLKNPEEIPDIFWYAKKFEFSLTKQKNKAPLIFILAGTGSDYKSTRVKFMERIFYTAGYHVISISSPMSSQFLISASSNSVPGILMKDNQDIYKAMKEAFNLVKDKVEVEDFYLMGYSLGGTNSAFVSYIDEMEQNKFFDFKRVFMLNPAVDLYNSSMILDNYLKDNRKKDREEKIEALIDNVLARMKNNMKNEYTKIDAESIFSIVKGDFLSDEEKEGFIGLAFRIASMDLNFISDVMTKSGFYTDNKRVLDKFTKTYPYFKNVNFATFKEYIDNIAYPYYKKIDSNISMEILKNESNLRLLENYLKNSPKIVAVTNLDELILTEKDFRFLKDTFGERIIFYPRGGHCGNMFYAENVAIMLDFLKEGKIRYE